MKVMMEGLERNLESLIVLKRFEAFLDEEQCCDLLRRNICVDGCVGKGEAFRQGEREYVEESVAPQGDMRRVDQVYAGGAFWVAKHREQVVGMVAVEKTDSHGEYELRRMHVHGDWRGKGLGKKLAMTAMDFVRKKEDFKILVLSTMAHYQGANALYEKLGFILVRKKPIHDDESFELFYEWRGGDVQVPGK